VTIHASQDQSPKESPDFSTERARHEAVRRRDARAEGHFYYSVLTTGVYCRPTCPARLAKPENVAFHRTPAEAERAGYRPCKRCRPREVPQEMRHAQIIEAARRLIDTSKPVPKLDTLAKSAGLSAYYFHRLFKKQLGMTPREYAAAQRLMRVTEGLREGATVTAAIYGAGYASSGRFYDGAGALGMTPSALRRGAEGVEVRAIVRECSLGHVLVAATARGVCAIAFGDGPAELQEVLRQRFPSARLQAPDPELDALASQIVDMIETPGTANRVPLDLIGTAFQQRVWRALRDIPLGTTATYAQIARRIGAPGAARAVGHACGKNPVAVAVPCHRVVREDGGLGGYRWGLGRKRALLERERTK
jgi:AraC family transcriptional regulator, regulatory protein of adaptative response / methylated-DNA-[protein]-cysteine methyltransferase